MLTFAGTIQLGAEPQLRPDGAARPAGRRPSSTESSERPARGGAGDRRCRGRAPFAVPRPFPCRGLDPSPASGIAPGAVAAALACGPARLTAVPPRAPTLWRWCRPPPSPPPSPRVRARGAGQRPPRPSSRAGASPPGRFGVLTAVLFACAALFGGAPEAQAAPTITNIEITSGRPPAPRGWRRHVGVARRQRGTGTHRKSPMTIRSQLPTATQPQEERRWTRFNKRAAAMTGMNTSSTHNLDLRDVRGQFGARRALEIAAADRHSLLMIGPRGCEKTMRARRLPGLLPAADAHGPRPFPCTAPHHTASAAGTLWWRRRGTLQLTAMVEICKVSGVCAALHSQQFFSRIDCFQREGSWLGRATNPVRRSSSDTMPTHRRTLAGRGAMAIKHFRAFHRVG